MANQPTHAVFSFGPFEADLETQELKRQGVRLRLPGQSFQILALLLQKRGQLIPREELQQTLWPANTFVDSEKGLNAAVNRLREALGDSAENPRYIETLPRRGYRFIAAVAGDAPTDAPGSQHSVPAPSAEITIAATAPAPRRASYSSRGVVALISFILLTGLGWARWRFSWRRSEVVERKLTLNSSENSVTSAAVSPDGNYLAYTDRTGIYLKLTRTGETHAVPLPANFSAHVDDWFPDGSHLLVTRGELPGKLDLWSVSIFGGSPRLLADDGRAGSLSPDGSRIAFQRSGFGREEWVMRADGTEQVKVADDQSSWVGQPTWSPDGTRIAYIRAKETYNARESSVELNEWRNSRAQTLFSDNRLSPSLHWQPNGLLLYALGDEENLQSASIWKISPQPGEKAHGSSKRIAPRAIGWINHLTGSHDGKVLAFTRENTVVSFYIGALAPDGTHLVANKRATFDESKNEPFAWTPDSKAILFHSNRSGTSEIYRQGAAQSLPERMMAGAEELQQPRVTPDGSEILFISTPKFAIPGTPSSIVAIPISGGPPRVVLRDSNIWNIQCASPPSTVCMYSVSKGDTSETFRFDVKTGKTQDPPQTDPWCNWSLSPDGSRRAVVYERSKGTIRLRSTVTGETHELAVGGWDELQSIVWSADGKALFVTWQHQSDTALLRVALDGTVSVLLRSSDLQILGAVPSPDGRSLAIAEQSTARNVWQIENF